MLRFLAFAAVVLVAATCASKTTPGDGVSLDAPASLTHGMCATFTINYLHGSDDVPAVATSPQSYSVTASNGALFVDTACTSALSGDVTIPTGSTSADFGFKPDQTGVICNIMVTNTAEPIITAGYSATPN